MESERLQIDTVKSGRVSAPFPINTYALVRMSGNDVWEVVLWGTYADCTHRLRTMKRHGHTLANMDIIGPDGRLVSWVL